MSTDARPFRTGRRPRRFARVAAATWLVALGLTQTGQGQQAPADAQAPDQELPVVQLPEQPIFRGGINFVRVDVIATDGKGNPVTDLKQTDFEVLEDDQPQTIDQFRLIKVDGPVITKPGEPPPREIRNRDDEEAEAAREDVRVFAFLLDDYHVRRANSVSIREPLRKFIETQVRPTDMMAVMYPLTPASEVSFTRNANQVISAIEGFVGRKYDYRPVNVFEQNYMRYPTDIVERIRNDVVMGALRGLSVRLGSLREGRKTIVFVSEGLTAILPPQMRRQDASMPADPIQARAGAAYADSPREETNAFFAQADVLQRMRDVTDMANRNNTSIYSLDPRGLATFEFDLDDVAGPPPSFATDKRVLQLTTDTLRVLSEQTDGRAIVNRNSLVEGLSQIIRDSSYYYLLGYNSKAPTDGKFHPIKVRVKRRGVDVRARRGFWAATMEDLNRVNNPVKEVAKPVQTALASISTVVQANRYVRTWVGSQKGATGKTRVTLVWEPSPAPPGARRDPIGGVALLVADASGNLVYRGKSAAPAPPAGPAAAARPASAPQQVSFDAPPGKLELRLTVEGADGAGTLDRENQTVEIPDFSGVQASLSTPRVFRARTARDVQMLQADPAAVPAVGREFSRTERLLIRFDAYVPGTEQATPAARLLNRAGTKMSDVPVTPGPTPGAFSLDVGLNAIPPGEYLVEIALKGGDGETTTLVPFRVGS
jgi:VWFA-related protein